MAVFARNRASRRIQTMVTITWHQVSREGKARENDPCLALFEPVEYIVGVTVSGHAGGAEKGKDIVCAGFSALFLSLIETSRRWAGHECLADADGKLIFQAWRSGLILEKQRQVFDFWLLFLEGTRRMIAKYPGHFRETTRWIQTIDSL